MALARRARPIINRQCAWDFTAERSEAKSHPRALARVGARVPRARPKLTSKNILRLTINRRSPHLSNAFTRLRLEVSNGYNL